ncbi:MAG: N-6 DNA methylase [Candidatus Thiodiazotropha endolucinida]
MATKLSNNTKKRKRGIYYTPSNVTDLLCDWAIRSAKDLILEPSFGGCGFLRSSKERLENLGCHTPNKRIFGCDIDKQAFKHLSEKIGPVDLKERFLLADFLSLQPSSFSESQFDVVIGNPPYVAHHDMYKEQRKAALYSLAISQYSIRGRTSLWAYFIIHSLKFIKQSGRMAWVLPGSLINTYYGREIINILECEFSKVIILPCAKRIFIDEGAKENTVVLLAEGKGIDSNGLAQVSFINSLDEFEEVAINRKEGILASPALNEKLNYAGLSRKENIVFKEICSVPESKSIGSLADIKIGIVTGNNKFFILTENEANKHKLPGGVRRLIFSKQNITQGVQLRKDDLEIARVNNFRCVLISTLNYKRNSKALKKYLDSYPEKKKLKVKTFKKRKVWHTADDGADPDGFFTYMSQNGPRLIINNAGSTSTNTIHRVYFKNISQLYKRKIVSISLLTTFSQLSAELEGRSYGSGVLKLEPSEAKAIMVYVPQKYSVTEVNQAFASIDNALRNNDIEGARVIADNLIFRDVSCGKIDLLKQALTSIRAHRIGIF